MDAEEVLATDLRAIFAGGEKMKKKKSTKVRWSFMLTIEPEEKRAFIRYCEKHNLSLSEYMILAGMEGIKRGLKK